MRAPARSLGKGGRPALQRPEARRRRLQRLHSVHQRPRCDVRQPEASPPSQGRRANAPSSAPSASATSARYRANLISEVYRKGYVGQWQDGWTRGLRDGNRPMRERLVAFYGSYAPAIFNRRWHGMVFYQGIREQISGSVERVDYEAAARIAVNMYLANASEVVGPAPGAGGGRGGGPSGMRRARALASASAVSG
jgi:hypothetical protein